ncbi:MAG: hypothetical protein CENE_01199 [Candidatus Celerinatantimonas neptuna]|nr:MAG: hypothetical protein CENE_01199 [Candidatus Celerinatantimonas neptuna]
MAFSVSEIVSQLTEQLENSSVKKDVCQRLCQNLHNKLPDLQALMQAHQAGDLTDEEFQLEIERERQIVEAEFLTEKIATKAALKKLLDDAFSALCKAIV